MKIIKGDNVTKYIHVDGSETVIKTTPSMEYFGDDLTLTKRDRNKYSILISSSVGCQMGCKMCGINPKTYKHLNSYQIIQNIKDAVQYHDFYIKSLSDMYAKLCFMGMGESILESTNFSRVPVKLMHFLTTRGYAKGVDSVDYGTIFPKNRDKHWVKRVIVLNSYLKRNFLVNKHNNHGSIVRIFYSLHVVNKTKKLNLIPMGDLEIYELDDVIEAGIDVIAHCTLIDGVNDSLEDIEALYNLFAMSPEVQLRMLRYNTNGKYQESKYKDLAWKLLSNLGNVKFQHSPGKEVNSACGQFYS